MIIIIHSYHYNLLAKNRSANKNQQPTNKGAHQTWKNFLFYVFMSKNQVFFQLRHNISSHFLFPNHSNSAITSYRFFISCLAASRPTFGHCKGEVLLTQFYSPQFFFDPKGFLSPAKHPVQLEPGSFQFVSNALSY